MAEFFASETFQNALDVLIHQFPLAIWETFYVTVLSTLFAILIGLPLGVLLVAGEDGKILRIPKWILSVLNVIINLLRSVPFLILMIMVFPLTRLIVGTVVGTPASVVPLVIAAFPFIARLVESSLREINPNIIEAAQSMGASPFPDFQRHHCHHYGVGVLRHERHHRRRRPGQDRHQLRLLSVSVPDHGLCRGVPHRHGPGVPEPWHLPGR